MAVFHAQLNQWGCDACRQMLPAPQPAMQQPPMQHPQQYYQPPQPMTPPCPQCRGPSTFYPAANTFGCDRCQIPVASPMPMPMQQQGSDAGAIVLKVVLFIVLVLVIIGVRVGLKSALR
jgi:hypothetical protein